MEDVPDSANVQSCLPSNQECASPESPRLPTEHSSNVEPSGALQQPDEKPSSVETDAPGGTAQHKADPLQLPRASATRSDDDKATVAEEDSTPNRSLSPARGGEDEAKPTLLPDALPVSQAESDDIHRVSVPEDSYKSDHRAEAQPEAEVGSAITTPDNNVERVTALPDGHSESDESDTAHDDPTAVVKGMDIDDPPGALLSSQEARRSPTPHQTQILVRSPTVEPRGRSGSADHGLHDSTTAVKGLDLDVAFTKSLDSVAVPVSNKQSGAVGDPIGRKHRRSAMQSRTLSVVSLLSKSGKQRLRLNKSQKLTLFCLCLVNFTSYLSYSVIAPFYPQEATIIMSSFQASRKGMREAVSGFVFSVYALTMMVFSPIFGKLVPILGTRFIFFNGIFFAGASNILFGLLDMAENTLTFTLLSFLVRIFEALGAAAFSTASYTIVLNLYPDHISTVFGIIETCVGVGMSLGPAIGGALYSVGGFGLPFYILGCCVLLTLPISWYLMRGIQVQATEMRKESYLTLLRVPQVIVVCIILVVGSQSQGFVEPTLEPHMRQEFGADTSIVGTFFLVMSAAFSICSPLVGYICMKTEQRIPIMIIGLILMSAAQLFMGPAPFLGIPSNLWMTLATVTVLGTSFAIAYVPTMESIIHAATDGGMEGDIGTYALVSGLWNSMYSLGEVIGPSFGGVLLDLIGFSWASTVVAGGSLLTAMMATLYWCCASRSESESFWSRRRRISDSGIEDSSECEVAGETTALLGSNKHDIRYNSL
ncbi:unnamed protein product [Ixodes hexagonus]